MKITNVNRIPTADFIKGQKGTFRIITKCRAGFMTISDCRDHDNEMYSLRPAQVLADYKKGALQTVQFKAEGGEHFLTVFARVGKKIHLIDEAMLAGLDVGTINSYWLNTDLYDQRQYAAVGAKTWADLAFVKKEDQPEAHVIHA